MSTNEDRSETKSARRSREWRERNPEKVVAGRLRHTPSEQERARSRERVREWQRENVEQKREYNRMWRTANPEKVTEYSRRARSRDPEKRRATWIKSKYKLDNEQYQAILDHPQTCDSCTVSFEDVRRHIDHCHATGRYRGLLCGPCNQAAGLLRDDPERAVALASYLRRVAGLI